jgi:putative proteasome-type protease
MTYCVGVKLEEGLVFASDSRTHAGVDNYAKFCKMTVFERAGERVLVLLSSGGLAATQAVIGVLNKRAAAEPAHTPSAQNEPTAATIWTADSMFDVANLVSDAMRDIERRDGPYLEEGGLKFNASFILGGQIAGEAMRLFRLYAEGNFIEASRDTTTFLQTGEAKYGKPILDLAVTPSATLEDATKCVLVSFDSTMLSNLSVGMPIDLLCYACDSLKVTMKRRFDSGDPYFETLKAQWLAGTRKVFHELPALEW